MGFAGRITRQVRVIVSSELMSDLDVARTVVVAEHFILLKSSTTETNSKLK